jgi:ABC-2 type transport system ATP-binding protein
MRSSAQLILMSDGFSPFGPSPVALTPAESPFYDESVQWAAFAHAQARQSRFAVETSQTVLSAMIIVKDLTKRYAHAVAVDQISFSVSKGQIVGFLGPNGAGKTTTMRILTCFLSPSAGSASVAGFDVLDQPLEVKRRIGYLPENPPLYPEMETGEYLRFVGKLKGISKAELEERVDYVCQRCFVADVKNKLLGKLSKGYRQRVGLAQAIIHNPDVLILDEPTAGLDPKQINETRDLIKSLAGDHTIILSTHILPEVEQICEQVIIINKGKVVATDSVRNLQARTRGDESLLLEVGGQPDALIVQQKLEAVPGVSRVHAHESQGGGLLFEVQSEKGQLVRGDLARTVVAAGWDLNELRPSAKSLEEVFLQLTGTAPTAEPQLVADSEPATGPEPESHPEPEKDQL